jgi:phosphate transport system substrate-binding protein
VKEKMESPKKFYGITRWRPLACAMFSRCTRVLAMGLLSSLMPLAAMADTVTVGGTGSAMGTMQRLAEAFQAVEPQFSMAMAANLGSNGGLKALAAGAIDLAVISRLLKPDERSWGLVAIEYGKTPFVFVTSKPGVTEITLQEAAEIYSGHKTTWLDGSPIRLVLRPAADSDTALLKSMAPHMHQAVTVALQREGMVMAITDQDSVNTIEKLPGAFGTSTLALLLSERRALVPLAVNGVAPSVATLADHTYPYLKSMYVVTKPDDAPTVQRFLAFLHSAAGREILHQTGHWVAEERPAEPHASR